MKYWSNVCVEGYCMVEGDNCPCGRRSPSPFCLLNNICPFFSFADATEREAAQFVPMYLVVWDRIKIWCNDFRDKVSWIFWDQLWFNRRKVEEFFKSIPVVTAEECPALAAWEAGERESAEKFERWIIEAKKNW